MDSRRGFLNTPKSILLTSMKIMSGGGIQRQKERATAKQLPNEVRSAQRRERLSKLGLWRIVMTRRQTLTVLAELLPLIVAGRPLWRPTSVEPELGGPHSGVFTARWRVLLKVGNAP